MILPVHMYKVVLLMSDITQSSTYVWKHAKSGIKIKNI